MLVIPGCGSPVIEGWSMHDILAHGIIDCQPVVAGTTIDMVDHMQQWFEAEAADGV